MSLMKNANTDNFDEVFEQIKNLINIKDYRKALGLSLETVRMSPDSSLAHYLSGVIARELNRMELSEEHLKRAVEIEPAIPEFRVDLAGLLAIRKKYDQAISVLLDAAGLNTDLTRIHEQLGTVLLQKASDYDIRGWFKPLEAAQLFLITSGMKGNAPTIVELGSFMGLSATIFAKALESKPEAKIICVDIWAEDGSSVFDNTRDAIINQHSQGETFYDSFLKRMRNIGILDKLTPVKSYTTDAAKTWTLPIDLLFIDAEHTYEGARNDYLAWHEFVKPGGYILFHDVIFKQDGKTENSGPASVVEEFVRNNPDYECCGLYKTLYCIRRKK